MTATQKNYLKNNWVTVANLALLVTLIFQQAKWQQSVDSRIEKLEEHSKNKITHMPFEKKIEIFVPRVELDGRLNNMQNTLNKIEKKLDNLN